MNQGNPGTTGRPRLELVNIGLSQKCNTRERGREGGIEYIKNRNEMSTKRRGLTITLRSAPVSGRDGSRMKCGRAVILGRGPMIWEGLALLPVPFEVRVHIARLDCKYCAPPISNSNTRVEDRKEKVKKLRRYLKVGFACKYLASSWKIMGQFGEPLQ